MGTEQKAYAVVVTNVFMQLLLGVEDCICQIEAV